MKKLLLSFLCFLLVFALRVEYSNAETTSVAEGKKDGISYKITQDSESQYYTLTVSPDTSTVIKDYTADNRNTWLIGSVNKINKLVVEEGITKIGNYAFSNKNIGGYLYEVQLPSTLTEIGERGFERNYYLTSFTLPNSVKKIGNSAFYDCFKIISFDLGTSLEEIGEGAFGSCRVKEITIPSSVKKIGANAFPSDVLMYTLNNVTLSNDYTFAKTVYDSEGNSLDKLTANKAYNLCLKRKCEIKFRNNKTEKLDLVYVLYGEKFPTPSQDKISGYKVTGWSYNNNQPVDFSNDNVLESSYDLKMIGGPITYTIMFDANGLATGEMDAITKTYNDDVTLPKMTFSCSEYNFDGWNTKADGSGIPLSDEYELMTDLTTTDEAIITLYAQWKTKYDTRKTITDISEPVTSGDYSGLYVGGRTFYETYYEIDETSDVPLATLVYANVWPNETFYVPDYVYANGKNCKVVALGKSGSYEKSMFLNGGGSIDSIDIPYSVTRINSYAFYSCFELHSIVFPGNITCIEENAFNYCPNFEEIVLGCGSTASLNASLGIEDLSVFKYREHVYDGISSDSHCVICNKLYDKFEYTVKFNANGGSGSMSNLTATYNVASNLPANKFTKNGYVFSGWNTQANGKGTSYKDKSAIKNLTNDSSKAVTLYAQWTPVSYKITYVLNKGKNSSSNPSKYNIASSTITLKAAKKDGYKFAGWYTTSKFTKKVTEIKKGSTGDKTFYAKFKPITYKIKFDKNGGKGSMKTISATYDKSVKLTKNAFKRDGYTFLGWASKKTAKKADYKNQSKVKNLSKTDGKTVTLYAVWKKNK